jgi:phosphoserine phosphatase RsbU/P
MKNWRKGFLLKSILLAIVFIIPMIGISVFEKFKIDIHRYLIVLIMETVVFLISYFIFELRLKEYHMIFRDRLKKINKNYMIENQYEDKFMSVDSMSNFEYFFAEEIEKLVKYIEKNNEKIVELEKENFTKFQIKEYQLKSVVRELEKVNDRMKRKEELLDNYVEMKEEMLNSVKNYNMFFDELLFFLEKKMKISDIMVIRYDQSKPIIYTKLANEKKMDDYIFEELKKMPAGIYYKKEINSIVNYEIVFILESSKYFHGYIFINGFSSKYLDYPVFMKLVSTVFLGILNSADNIRDREEADVEIEELNCKMNGISDELKSTQVDLENQLIHISNMYEEIVTLYEAGKSIGKVLDIKDIETLIMDMMVDIVGVESAFIFYYNESKEYPMLKNQFFKESVDENFIKDMKLFIKNSTLYFNLTNSFKEINVNRVIKSEYAEYFTEYLKNRIRNFMVTPIYFGEKIKGGIILCNHYQDEFTAGNISLVSALTNQLGMAVQNIEFLSKEIDRKKEEEQMKIASDIQSKLFPQKIPEIKNIQFHGISLPAKSVGGDYYDIIKIDDNISVGIIADVSGKGVPAALLVSMLRTVFRMIVMSEKKSSPDKILEQINEVFANEDLEGRFITSVCFKILSKERKIQMADAGHGNVMHYKSKDGTITELPSGGIVIGVMENEKYEIREINLAPNDILMFFTDGVVDERNEQNEFFGNDRLQNIIQQESKYPAEFITRKVYKQIFKFLNGHDQYDDITIVTLKGV